jgi:hypothetical protein
MNRPDKEAQLLAAIKENLPKLEVLLARIEEHWAEEDMVYRYYHQSFKAYGIQGYTEDMVAGFRSFLPDMPLNKEFEAIVAKGTGRRFQMADNAAWREIVGPMFEAFWHAKYFLRMMIKYGRSLETLSEVLASGWASVLYLYNLR